MSYGPQIETRRLLLRTLTEGDVTAMARLLGDPHVSIRVLCDASTPAKCRRAAAQRIDWFNSYWRDGYGVRGITIRDSDLGTPGTLIGWCGVAGFEGSHGEPELLYGLARPFWGRGLVTEAGRATIDEFFHGADEPSLCAVIFDQLNRSSVRVARKLGMKERDRVAFAQFVPNAEKRLSALEYALWCATSPAAREDPELQIHAAAKAGLLVGAGAGERADIEERLHLALAGSDNREHAASAFASAYDDPTCAYLSVGRRYVV